ncbi:hypothetical protein NH399_19570 [Pleionea sp. CnH1-48]|nr:hypothetical protein [Pleionea sp. CnH1-48]
MLDDLVGEIIKPLFRFLKEILIDLVLEPIFKLPGHLICRLLGVDESKNRYDLLVLLFSLFVWAGVIFCYFLFINNSPSE